MNRKRQEQGLLWKRRLFPELVRLAWPIAVSMLSFSIMTLTDTLFVGRLGASALAGVGLGGIAGFSVLCFGLGLLRSVKVVVSQAVGAGRDGELPAWLGAGVLVAIAFGAIAISLGALVARALPGLAVDADAGHQAASYLGVRILGAPLALVAVSLREARYGRGEARWPMISAVVANLANIPLDALLVVGLGWGVAGAAWATVACNLVEASLLVAVQRREGFGFARVRRSHVAALVRLGAPLGVQMLLEVGSFAVLVAILARIGEVDLAAHQIALQITHFSFLPAFALGEAASILAGQAVGADEDGQVRRVARAALAAAVAYTGACAVVMATCAPGLAAVFTTDRAVQALAVRLLHVAAVFQIFDGANVVGRSALRGTGDVRVPAVIGVACAWLLVPPLTAILGIGFGLGAFGGWLGLCAEIVAGSLLLWWRLERRRWLPAAARSRARLAAAPEEHRAVVPALG